MSKIAVFTFIALILLASPAISEAQADSSRGMNIRFELGAGLGVAGQGGGLDGRLATMFVFQNWGGIVRVTAHDGGEGESVQSFIGTHTAKEKFYDSAILLSHVFIYQNSIKIIPSAGFGAFWGEKLDDENISLEKFDTVPGFAFELSLSSGGRVCGVAFTFIGNVNAESSAYGIIVSFTIGTR